MRQLRVADEARGPADPRSPFGREYLLRLAAGAPRAFWRIDCAVSLGRQILSFDETGVAAEGGYRFRAPTPSQTLSAKAQREREAQRPGSRGRIAARAPWLRASRYDVTETTP
jgi:hypothetical protein